MNGESCLWTENGRQKLNGTAKNVNERKKYAYFRLLYKFSIDECVEM